MLPLRLVIYIWRAARRRDTEAASAGVAGLLAHYGATP